MNSTYLNELDLFRRKAAAIEDWRQRRLPFMHEVDDYLIPNRAVFDGNNSAGFRTDENIITSTARLSFRTLVANLMSGNIPRSSKWFNLVTNSRDQNNNPLMENDEAKAWLSGETDAQYNTYSNSNFYAIMPFHFLDAAAFFCGLTLVELSFNKTNVYTDCPPGTYTLGYNADGAVNQVARDVQFTLEQLVEKFGLESISEPLQNQYRDPANRQRIVNVVHYVGPNNHYDHVSFLSDEKAWASVWWEKDAPTGYNRFLRRSGYDEFPYLVSEWWDCPAYLIMSDILQLYRETSDKLLSIELANDPPLTGPASLKDEGIAFGPGTYYPVKAEGEERGVRPVLPQGVNLEPLFQDVEKLEKIIDRGTYADVFTFFTQNVGQEKTAYEAGLINQEAMRQLVMVVESFNRMLDHNCDVTFSNRQKLGLVESIPVVLGGATFHPDYISSINQAQKLSGMNDVRSFMLDISNISATFPAVLDKVNPDKYVEAMGVAHNVPNGLINDDQTTQQIRASKQQAQMESTLAQSYRQQAAALKDLGTTPVEDNSLLSRMANAAPTEGATQVGAA